MSRIERAERFSEAQRQARRDAAMNIRATAQRCVSGALLLASLDGHFGPVSAHGGSPCVDAKTLPPIPKDVLDRLATFLTVFRGTPGESIARIAFERVNDAFVLQQWATRTQVECAKSLLVSAFMDTVDHVRGERKEYAWSLHNAVKNWLREGSPDYSDSIQLHNSSAIQRELADLTLSQWDQVADNAPALARKYLEGGLYRMPEVQQVLKRFEDLQWALRTQRALRDDLERAREVSK